MTYWCPIGQCYTDPPRLKRDGRNKRTTTHVLHDGKALCGKRSPTWFHHADEKPTCPACLSKQQAELYWWERWTVTDGTVR